MYINWYVGYGDVPLETDEEHLIAAIYIIFAIAIFSYALNLLTEIGNEVRQLVAQIRALGMSIL